MPSFRPWTDELAKQELLRRAKAGEPRPRTFAEGATDKFENFLAERLAAFTNEETEDDDIN